MSRVIDKKRLNEIIIELFGQDIRLVRDIEMRDGLAVITYWPSLDDTARLVTDTYRFIDTE